jgi:hypothetical protein
MPGSLQLAGGELKALAVAAGQGLQAGFSLGNWLKNTFR